jgi:hypothetical protein
MSFFDRFKDGPTSTKDALVLVGSFIAVALLAAAALAIF